MNKENLSEFFTFRYWFSGKQVVKVPHTEPLNYSFSEYKQELRRLLENATIRGIKKGETVGCFLSGGIDSSVVCSILSKHTNVVTFSLDFGETEYINKVARHLGIENVTFKLEEEEAFSYLEKMIPLLPYPIGDPGILPFFFLSKKANEFGIKKVFNGEGGDEVFCGYDKYKMFKYGRFLSWFVPFTFGHPVLKRLKAMRGKNEYEAFAQIIRLFSDEELKELGVKKFDAGDWWRGIFQDELMNAQHFDLVTSVPYDFIHKGTVCKYYGVTQNAPMLDQPVVDFMFSVPTRHKLRGWNEKFLLKQAYKDDLPIEVIERPKQGLPTPINKWMKGSFGNRLKELLDENNHKLYNKEYIYKLLEKFKKSKSGYKTEFIEAQKLYACLVFEMWIKYTNEHNGMIKATWNE